MPRYVEGTPAGPPALALPVVGVVEHMRGPGRPRAAEPLPVQLIVLLVEDLLAGRDFLGRGAVDRFHPLVTEVGLIGDREDVAVAPARFAVVAVLCRAHPLA